MKISDGLVVLTFDDGNKSDLDFVAPILKSFQFGATFFITEGLNFLTNKNHYMDWSEIKEISSFEFVHIGNHSHTHDYLVDKSDKEIEDDLKTSINIFKEKLNHETKFFAYPLGI